MSDDTLAAAEIELDDAHRQLALKITGLESYKAWKAEVMDMAKQFGKEAVQKALPIVLHYGLLAALAAL